MNIVVNKRTGKRYTPDEIQTLIHRIKYNLQGNSQYSLDQEIMDFLEAVKTILESQPDVDLIVDKKRVKTAYHKPVARRWAGLLSNIGV